MKSIALLGALAVALLPFASFAAESPSVDVNRLRELRDKAKKTSLTPAEQAEFDRGANAYRAAQKEAAPKGKRDGTVASESQTNTPDSTAARRAAAQARQAEELEENRRAGKEALIAAAARQSPVGPGREFHVNNETGDDAANGRAAAMGASGGPVKTLKKAVSLLQPGDTLHFAVTGQPYRDTLRLEDGFGGVPGRPIVIDGHGVTLTGSDPLRLDGWVAAGVPGLYRSAKMLSELDEAGDDSKLMRVFFIFDGVMQHMGRTSKGARAAFRPPAQLQPGEWTYVEAEKTFYIKVAGKLADAKIEAPYRRNGVATRGGRIAVTDVVIKNLITCHVLNDGFNLHGASKNVLLQNIAAYECGDDGISPHGTCEVAIDGFWSIGNSTGMGNGYVSVTTASNIHLEGNLAAQFMTAHAAFSELRNVVMIAPPGSLPLNLSNDHGSQLSMDNVRISTAPGQKIAIATGAKFRARRATVVGPDWENRGMVQLSESVIAGGTLVSLDGGSWRGRGNIYDAATAPPGGEESPARKSIPAEVLTAAQTPYPGAGADVAEFRLPPRPVPHPAAGRFASLRVLSNP